MKKNSHAPEIVTHITSEHAKGNIFEGSKDNDPKCESGCYANSMHPSRQEKM